MKKMEKEIRNLGNIELRAAEDGNSRHVEGYAMVFDSQSEFLGFYETIERGAITQELVDECDIFATFNHDMNKVFARSNKTQGSLSLSVDEKGLKFEFDVPNTALGDELLEYMRRGDINKCSFAFALDPNDDEAETWESKDGVYFRTIHKIAALFDIAICWVPAYSDTEVSKRAKDKIDALENERIAKINTDLDEKLNEIEELAKL
jgi:HK97 family phage prohead protease